MAQLTSPIGPDGLIVDVLVNLEAPALLSLRSANQPRPPVPALGLLDTGSNVTGIALPILQKLGALVVGQSSTTSIVGSVGVNLYRVSLHVWDQRNSNLPWLTQPSLLVMELPAGFPYDVLIGMDVLRTCKTIVDGPGGIFTLEF